jgi:hypothetical protein
MHALGLHARHQDDEVLPPPRSHHLTPAAEHSHLGDYTK